MPIAAAIPAIIGAAGAAGGMALGGMMGRKSTSSSRGLLEATGTSANEAGNVNINNATQNLASAGDFYRTLMSGNMQQIQQLLGPEISGVNQQYNQIQQANAQLQPRSGLTASANASLPFQREATIGNAILSAPLTGASGLAGVGGTQAGFGTNLFNTSNQAGAALGNIGLGITSAGLQAANMGNQIGGTFGNAIDWSKVGKGIENIF